MIVECGLQEPWFSLIKSGRKTCEGRLYRDKWMNIGVNDTIIFKCGDNKIKTRVISVRYFDDFYAAYAAFGDSLLPDSNVGIYDGIYTNEEIGQHGVVVFSITLY